MPFGYLQPFLFQIGPRPIQTQPTVTGIRHGVTEITLSDGRLVRASLHVRTVKTDLNKPGSVEISCNVVAEIMPTPELPIRDMHETIQ